MLSYDALSYIVRYALEMSTRQFRGYLANKEGISQHRSVSREAEGTTIKK